MSQLKRIISSLWGSDEIRYVQYSYCTVSFYERHDALSPIAFRRTKPTPQQEAFGGIAILESVLWDAVPAYLRKLDAQCLVSLGRRLPVDVVPIRFASWIGGDRDGNPNVTPEVTSEVVNLQRLRAAKLYLNDLNKLYNELAISSRFSDEMNALADTIRESRDEREKYRRVIGHLRQRLVRTIKECEAASSIPMLWEQSRSIDSLGSSVAGWKDVEPIYDSKGLMEPLRIMHDSLMATGYEMVADGLLIDVIRRLAVFGLTLVPLDIREESTKHTEALNAITRWLGIGSYKEWDEEARLSFLQSELAGKRPLFQFSDLDEMGFDDDIIKTLRTFEMASKQKPEAMGAYVISQAQTASDVLAVMLLQKSFGMTSTNGNMMRVVPLFETLDDLVNAPDVLETLFSIPYYVGNVKGRQEVMVGYSDSAKDAGRLAASWALYENQEKMAAVAQKYGIELTFFHGKGGTVGRGGNPALYRAILSHPPNTINGRFRVTEQGEMITQNFGSPAIAERTLDIYTAAVLREAFTKHVEPTKEWRKEMQRISDVSCADYRQLVREEPRFVPYFRQATPELELGNLNVGSRPAKRNPKGGVESLRAIPWQFAWAQTRTMLPAWSGVGAGLHAKVRQPIDFFFLCLLHCSRTICLLTLNHRQRMKPSSKLCRICTTTGHGSEKPLTSLG
jgi:phosphoenolpyruvate carboxylase